MKRILLYCTLSLCYWSYVNSSALSGPRVYVVTPASRQRNDEGRSAPFYYHNWIRRMDSPKNTTTTTTPSTPKTKTPDLIFAEFESDSNNNMKSIRKLLENERVEPSTTTTTTSRPIYVPDDTDDMAYRVNYGLPVTTVRTDDGKKTDMTDYFALYNNLYGNEGNLPAPVYVPGSPTSTTSSTTPSTTTTTTTTTPAPLNVENIWHIIDSEKYNKYAGKWEEENVPEEDSFNTISAEGQKETVENHGNADASIDEHFALPGFSTNPGNGAENESRAIRTEPNIRFPYVNLKPFQMKKPLLNSLSNTNKINNMLTSLDNFHDLKNPVRGEAQDIVSMRQPIDRYNPAQPYLPPSNYGSKSKQSNPNPAPGIAVANLVPPPPPPRPQLTDNDFPTPTSYESFPPYAPSDSMPPAPAPSPPSPPPAPKQSPPRYQPPIMTSDDSDSPPGDSDDTPDVGYRYKQPSPPVQPFVPTIPPLTKPFLGYSYDKPSMTVESPPMGTDDKPYHGYHYNKPPSPPSKPSLSYGNNDDHPLHHDYPHDHDSDYPDLIFDKPHGGMDDSKTDEKGMDDSKDSGMGMMPPPPPPPDMDSQGPPSDDHGFPHDFPGDFKYHHDFDDHDHDYHYHHHHTTTTTTTTETPRVNRYSYYYLGKKLYYLPLYFSVYFIVYVGALIIKAVLRHKIVYPNSWRPNDQTASFFSKRSVESWDLSKENLHEITGRVSHAIATAAEKYMNDNKKQ